MAVGESIPDIDSGASKRTELPLARLETISFTALRDGDAVESKQLFNACCKHGIFYLDMRGTQPDVLRHIEEIYALEENVFSLPEAELLRHDIDKLSPRKLNGYKPVGRNRGELADGRDGFESYALPKDGVMNLGGESHFKRPAVVDSYLPSLHVFTLAISAAVSAILRQLSSALQLPQEEDLRTAHRTHLPSPDLIRLLKYQAQPIAERGASHLAHTDLGSMTFLFTKQYGLQVQESEHHAWNYVEPRAGCATVNIGDCLSLLTNKLFRSCRHRVQALPGQAMRERYSFAYFLRADDETLIKAVNSPLIAKDRVKEKEVFTSGEWMKRKYAMLRKDTWNKDSNWILTGG